MFIRIMALCVVTLFFAGCSESDSDRDRGLQSAYKESLNPYVKPDTIPFARSSHLGNFTIVNNTRDTLIVGTHAMFEKSGQYLKITGASATIDIRGMGTDRDLVRLYAMTETDLELLRQQGAELAEAPEGSQPQALSLISASPLYIPTEGGTWNPYGWASNSEATKYGTVAVCNYQDRIVGITVGHPLNELEGLVNRGACNVPLKLPADGLVTLFAIDMETSEVLREETIGLVEDSIAEFVIGAYDYPDAPAFVRLVNHANVHVNVYDRMTQQPMYNEACNYCNTVIAGSVGDFNIEASLELQIDALPTDGEAMVQSPVFVAARGETVELVLDRDAEGVLRLRQVVAQECRKEQPQQGANGYYDDYYSEYHYYDDYGYPDWCFAG